MFSSRVIVVFFLVGLFCLAGKAADYVVIIDASISMKNSADSHIYAGKRRLDVVSDALNTFLGEIPLESRVYLAAFNRVVTPETEVVVRSESDRKRLIQSISNLESLVSREAESGGTHLWAALDHALQKGSEYSQASVDQNVLVRVLTDGEDNDPKYRGVSAQSIINGLRQKYPLVGDRVGLVLLGSMDFHLHGIEIQNAKDFHPSFPPAIALNPRTPRVGQPVTFSDSSQQRFNSFDWLVDDQLVSRTPTAVTTFAKAGKYHVKLTVVAANGQRETGNAVVQVGAAPMSPSFTFVPAKPEPTDRISLYGRASADASVVKWRIDGAEAGSGYDLQKEFASEGEHEIVLTVQDSGGSTESVTNQITVAEKPLTVTFDAPEEVVSGSEVEFKNTTMGRTGGWRWDFGDQKSGPEQHPHHVFLNASDQPVQFAVVLHAQSVAGREFASESKKIIVHPSPKPPKAAFQVRQFKIKVGDLINFQDDSTGVITNRHWSFADEGESAIESPEHAFRTAGEKSVKLTVTGPGGSVTATQKVTVRPRETSVKVALMDSQSMEAAELPPSLDFKDVNPDSLHQNTFIGIDKDTIQVSFADQPEDGTAVVVTLAGTNDVFHLQLRRDGKLFPVSLPARLRENSLIQVTLNTNAPEGKYEAALNFQPEGTSLLLNGTNQPVALTLLVNIGTPESGGFIALLLLVILAVVAWAIYFFWRQRTLLGPKSQVTIGLAEQRDEIKSAGVAAGTSVGGRKYKLAYNEMIVLGQSTDSPHLFDLQAQDWRIRREAKQIVLVNRRDIKSRSVLNTGDVKEIKADTGAVRRLAVTIEINAPVKPLKVAPKQKK